MSRLHSRLLSLLSILVVSFVHCADSMDYVPLPESKTGWHKNINMEKIERFGVFEKSFSLTHILFFTCSWECSREEGKWEHHVY